LHSGAPVTIEGVMKVTLLHFGLLAFLATPAAAFSAQDADESALDALDNAPKPPPPKIEPAGAAELRDAVRRIAQRPTDSFALSDAGYAAIKLRDYDAAFNFFTKANAIQPSDARIKVGLGISQVRRENPFEALKLFDDATRLGASDRTFALERALAFDLLGNFERAERDYALAASYGGGDELTLRHAISLSLAGRKDEADRMLIPMLQKENPEAWRTRALMLASRGDYREAGKIALGFLSDSEARRMDGYFRNMPRLTGAQQAAAMHFGHFPVGSNIGEDSNSVRTMAAATGAKPAPAGGDARLIPTGEPLGAKTAAVKPDKAKKPDKKDAKRNSGVATATAQEAIDAAAKAKVSTVAANRLPPPEAARPPVRIALPALARPEPAAVAKPEPRTAELPSTGPAVVVSSGAPKAATPQPMFPPKPLETAADQSAAELPATGPAVIASSGAPKAAQPEPMFPPKPLITEPKPSQEVRVAQLDPALTAKHEPAVVQPQPQPVIIDRLPPVEPETKIAVATDVNADVPSPGFDVNPIGPAIIAQAQSAPSDIMPVDVPASEKPFDLGALVESIEVPEDEKKPSVAPVDLTKIKPAAPKAEAVAAKTDPAAKTAKQSANTPRIWVQIATGSDVNGLGFDYRRMAKKNAALFANREGWTATWGKTRRLLVGPFPDMKAAKKWEADYRKAGGDGFVWQSDKTAEVTKLK
jgi:tetratricopeptide (TPR) repeat protein